MASPSLHDAISGEFIDDYVNLACAVLGAIRRRRYYGRNSTIWQNGEIVYRTLDQPESLFAPEPRVYGGGGSRPDPVFNPPVVVKA